MLEGETWILGFKNRFGLKVRLGFGCDERVRV